MEQLSLHIGIGPPPPLPARPTPSLPARIGFAKTEHTVTPSSGLPPQLSPQPMLSNISNAIHSPSQATITNLQHGSRTPEHTTSVSKVSSPAKYSKTVETTIIEKKMQQYAAKARERACKKYNKAHTIGQFSPGDIISLKIPKEDRAATDPHRMFARVLEENHTNCYKLQTQFGMLQRFYPVSQLLQVPMVAAEDIENIISRKEMNTTLSLHAAAARVSTSERIAISCNCKGPQCSGRCRCIKNKVKCSVHCHSTEFDCGNLSNLQTRTEIALVQYSPVTTTRPTDDTGSELSELDERWLLEDEEEEEEEEEEEANGQLEMEATLSGKSLRSRRHKRADTSTSTPPRKTRRTEA